MTQQVGPAVEARSPLPLDGIRVLDLTTFAAGPIASMMLGDLGADVLKIEHPNGDPVRTTGLTFPGGWSTFFLAVNRNKRFVSIDYKTEAGQALIHHLVREADVFIENARPGTWAKYGLGYEALQQVNDQLVYVSLSGFGQKGPMRDWIAMDPVGQAVGGVIGITGSPDAPAKVGAAIMDVVAGRMAAHGAITALLHRERFGGGQYVDTSLFDAGVSLMSMRETEYQFTGEVPERRGTAHGQIAPAQTFRTKDDRWVMVSTYGDDHFRRFCEAIDRAALADDPRFATGPARLQNLQDCIDILQAVMKERTQDEWTDRLAGVVPYGPVLEFDALWDHPQLDANDLIMRFEQPGAGEVRTVGAPVRLSRHHPTVRTIPGPVGRDTRAVLQEVGIAESQIDAWEREGAIFTSTEPVPPESAPLDDTVEPQALNQARG